jgi:phenylpropionate dioxygenase-like ring-hydroxylating dioxygenase large terminal subunit
MNAALARPLPASASPDGAPPRALPAWVYNHPQMTRLEYERIIRPSWQIVCHVSSIPHAGDYVTLDLGPDSVFAVRAADGGIHTFHNVCRHRGAHILDGQGHCPKAIICPYHGWSYRLSGELRGVPSRESFPGLDREAFALKPVRSEVMLGFVFVCLEGDPPPLADIWRGIREELAAYDVENMVPCGPIAIEPWRADWKIAMDNYLESYHVPIGHPGLARMFTPDYEDHRHLTQGVARGNSWMREQLSSKWSERMYQSFVGRVSESLPEPHRRCWRFYSVLPNLGIDVFPEQMDFFQVLPDGPGRCIIRTCSLAHPDERREMRIVRWLGARLNEQINSEDRSLCARVQQGLASPSYEPGPLSRLEDCMLEFHDLLRQRIPEVRLPHAPAHFA